MKPMLAIVALAVAGCAHVSDTAQPAQPAKVPEILPGFLQGYLSKEALPNSLALIPPPPSPGSGAFAFDEEIMRKSLALHGTPRWTQATLDADLRFPHAADTFSCVLDVSVTQARTPYLYQLLRRTMTDAGLATYSAKDHYQRTRPFVANQAPICTPQEQAFLAKDGSYPSGHTAIGWAWAMVLIEIAPARTDAIAARGRAFGENRNICNVHWRSDVLEGRFVAAATVARLQSEPAFRSDLAAAKKELAAAQASGAKPTRDCRAEAAALAQPL